MDQDIIVGIDLGTTNSEVAVSRNGKVEVIDFEGETIMPSVVGLDAENNLLIGTPAKNQAIVFPEKTIMSIKRLMGTEETIQMGSRSFKPGEISAIILRELKGRAEIALGRKVKKAVITVPAFFSEAQRKATHDAGEIAGFEVMRILNEPTAASLAYEGDPNKTRLLLVYDLGGGTFDVSVVETHGEVTEVLASHGDTKLGGNDFDNLLFNDVVEALVRAGNPDPRNNRLALSRLKSAVVNAKHELSFNPYSTIREENLLERDGVPIHVNMEVSRTRYEELIHPLVEQTFNSISQALSDSGKKPADFDAVLLVGGMTRTPLVERRLSEVFGKPPRRDVHPDLAVALGAGIMASRIGGQESGRILVDITPYSFGPAVTARDNFGIPFGDVFSPVIHKGTPLPTRETAELFTLVDKQEKWNVQIFQGEHPIASRNIKIGNFVAEGFAPVPAGNPILCTLELDLDGILHVTVVEKMTGLSKKVRIDNALGNMKQSEIEKARKNLDAFFAKDNPIDLLNEVLVSAKEDFESETAQLISHAQEAYSRGKEKLPGMSGSDKKDLEAILFHVQACLDKKEYKDLPQTLDELEDLMYFTEEV